MVYANGTGNRVIELRNNNGIVLQTATINIPDGQSRINLNFNIPVGQNLQLGWQQGSQPDLYRNNSGPSYPYTLNGVVSITNSSAGQAGFYYGFYDWDITTPSCTSARVPLTVSIFLQIFEKYFSLDFDISNRFKGLYFSISFKVFLLSTLISMKLKTFILELYLTIF